MNVTWGGVSTAVFMFEAHGHTAASAPLTAFADLSAVAEAVHRATESGCGVLSVGRPWVLYEGWVLKEAGLTGGWHLRYFVVSGERLEYFKEERVRHDPAPGEPALSVLTATGCSLDRTNVVTAPATLHKGVGLQEGDVVVGINNEPVIGRLVCDVLASMPTTSVVFTVLRPKDRISLLGASVAASGPRKQGGHLLTVSTNDSSSRRSRYSLVCAEERLCAGWIAAIKEGIAASAMEEIKSGLSQAMAMQALQYQTQMAAQQPQKSVGDAASAQTGLTSVSSSAGLHADVPIQSTDIRLAA